MPLLRRSAPAAALTALAASSLTCANEYEGSVCVYTARSPGQVLREIPDFLAKHNHISLRCPDAPREDVYCESRWRADENSPPIDCASDSWEVVRLSTDQLLDALNNQAGAGTLSADVIWGLGMSHLLRVITGFGGGIHLKIRPYAPEGLDNLEREIQRRTASGAYHEWNNFLDTTYQVDRELRPIPMWTGIDAFAAVLCVNFTKMAAANLDPVAEWTWAELTKEAYQGRIVMPKASTSGTGFIAAAGLLWIHGGFDSAEGWSFLDEIDKNVAAYTNSGDAPCNRVADPLYPDLVIGVTHDAADALNVINPVVKRVFPAEGVGYDIAGIALVDKPEVGLGALKFLDWASQDAMLLYSDSTPLVAYPRPELYPPGYPDPVESAWLDYEFGALAGARLDIQIKWKARYCSGGSGSSKCE